MSIALTTKTASDYMIAKLTSYGCDITIKAAAMAHEDGTEICYVEFVCEGKAQCATVWHEPYGNRLYGEW